MKKLLLTLLCIFTLSSWHANAQLTEGFESGVFPPTNWTQEYVSAAVDWSTSNGNANGSVSGSNSGSLNASFVANNYSGNSTRLVTPTLDLSAGASYDLSFYHTQVDWGGDQDVLTVYYKTSAASAWVELVNYPSAVYSWTQEPLHFQIYLAITILPFKVLLDMGVVSHLMMWQSLSLQLVQTLLQQCLLLQQQELLQHGQQPMVQHLMIGKLFQPVTLKALEL